MSDKKQDAPGVTHQPEYLRFVAEGGGVLDYLRDGGERMVITHVEVPEHLRGGGVASALVEAALAYAAAHALEVVAECSYAAVYLKRRARTR